MLAATRKRAPVPFDATRATSLGQQFHRVGWAINGRFLTQPMTGVQRYANEIVCALDDILTRAGEDAPAMRLVVPPGVEATPALSSIGICRTHFGSGHAWDQLVLPFFPAAGVLSLGNFGPLLTRSHVVCIHDANTFIQPESYSLAFGLTYRMLLPVLGRRANRVATVSRFSATMLVKYGIACEEKIFIAHNGHEHVLRWNADRAQASILEPLKRPYVLLLGSTAKHKNVDVILRQAQALDEAGIDIAVAGGGSSIFAADNRTTGRPNIHYVGFVSDDDLAALYQRALCLVFPSRTEGFGIPPLEAMTLGCPVISSSAASLKEVGGDAVLYVDPDDADRWRDAILGLAGNADLRVSLAAKGRQQAALFSWTRSAQVYLEEIQRVLAC
jgi:glycosyltransferase involved in cell wall biosynthesis